MGYINKSYLQTQFSNFAARITAIFAKKTDIPTNMTGATASAAGKAGLAPAPAAGDNGKYLCGDGTWKEPTASVDALTSMEQVEASTDASKPVGAGAVKELSNSLGGVQFGIDENGNYGYIKAGADTVTPFSSIVYTSKINFTGTLKINKPYAIYVYTESATYSLVRLYENNECVLNSPTGSVITGSTTFLDSNGITIFETKNNKIVNIYIVSGGEVEVLN